MGSVPENFHGKEGKSGRKSAYLEHLDAEWHALVWKEAQDVDGLEEKIKSKKYAGRDMAALRLLKGDKHIIGKFMDKLVPDLHDVTSKGERVFYLPSEILSKHNLDNYVDSNPIPEGNSERPPSV